jgi:hypothetical protein
LKSLSARTAMKKDGFRVYAACVNRNRLSANSLKYSGGFLFPKTVQGDSFRRSRGLPDFVGERIHRLQLYRTQVMRGAQSSKRYAIDRFVVG